MARLEPTLVPGSRQTPGLHVIALFVHISVQLASSEISGPECCTIWTREGWSRLKDLPLNVVSHEKPADCGTSNVVAPLLLNWRPRARGGRTRRAETTPTQLQPGSRTTVSWSPNGNNGDLGLSFCSDPSLSVCYMLDVFGVSSGRLGFWWRKHSAEEPGVESWVPGRLDHVPETLLNTEGKLEDCAWPNNGETELEINMERTEASAMRVWMAGGDPSQADSMTFPLMEELPHLALSPHVPLGQLNVATAGILASQKASLNNSDAATINPLLMRGVNLLQRPGNRVVVKWRPDDPLARMGFAVCRDRQQSLCFVLTMYGVYNGRLCYLWARHSGAEPGLAGWVAGRRPGDRVPSRILRSQTVVRPGSWPPGTQTLSVDRTQQGMVRVELQGGDPAQASELTFPIPDEFSFFTVAASDSAGFVQSAVGGTPQPLPNPPQRPQTSRPPTQRPPTQRPPTQRPPTQRPPTQRPQAPRPQTQRPQVPRPQSQKPQTPWSPPPTAAPPAPAPEPEEHCAAAVRVNLLRGQEMLVVWQPRAKLGNLGVSFCRREERERPDCFVLDLYGFQRGKKKLAYSLRHHGPEETGDGAWVPGREELVPERHMNMDATPPGWPVGDSSSPFRMTLTWTNEGTMAFRMDGLDGRQQEQMAFHLPDGYDNVAIAATLSQDEFHVRGPCFNGVRFNFNSLLCHLPDAGALNVDNNELISSWTLKPQTSTGFMRSPAMAGVDGQICVSVVGLALGNANMIIELEDITGAGKPLKLAEIIPNRRQTSSEWHRVHKTISLTDNLREGQVRVVVRAVRGGQGAGVVLLRQLEFCSPDTCGSTRGGVIPLIAHGKEAQRGDFPWFAGIFKQDLDSWNSICGGTLVRPDIVISAAHCFYDDSSIRLFEFSLFRVTVGKYKREWNLREPDEQRSVVTEIIVPERYRGSVRIYDNDIAFLRVHFTISSIVLPICIDWRKNYTLRKGDVGVVAGWGVTEDLHPSTSLQFAKMPFVPYEECMRYIPSSLAKYITSDKFCAGNRNGSTVWPGDSGGGLSFLRGNIWYLNGIVSTGVPGKLTYSAYTNVNDYLDLLTKFIAAS